MGGGGGLLWAALMLQEPPRILGGLRLDSAAGTAAIFGWKRLPRAPDVVFEIKL